MKPEEFMKYVHHLVEVTTIHASHQGIVVTVDPESGVIILLGKETLNKIYLINGEAVKSTTDLDSSPLYVTKAAAYLNALGNHCLPNNVSSEVTANSATCLKLLKWLIQHNYRTINENGVLKISDTVVILPPYGIDQCISTDIELLKKVKICVLECMSSSLE